MNERIRELMEEAGIYDFVVESMGINEELNKFAEWIVQECIDYCGENLSKTVGAALKIHFGVEE